MVGYGLSRGEIDTDYEILTESYATAYDSLNNLMVSDNTRKPTSVGSLRRTFSNIKHITRKYAPQKMHVVERLEMYAIAHAQGKLTDREFLVAVRTVAEANGLDTSLIAAAELKVNHTEAKMLGQKYNPFIYSDKPIKPRGVIPGFFPVTNKDTFFTMPKDFFGYGKTFDLHPQPKGRQVIKPIIPRSPILLFKKPTTGKPFVNIKPLDFGGKPFIDTSKSFFPLAPPAKRVEKKRKPILNMMDVFALPKAKPPASAPKPARMAKKGKGLNGSFLPKFELKKPRWF